MVSTRKSRRPDEPNLDLAALLEPYGVTPEVESEPPLDQEEEGEQR